MLCLPPLTHDGHGEPRGETEVVAESPSVVEARREVDRDAEAGDEELGPAEVHQDDVERGLELQECRQCTGIIGIIWFIEYWILRM